MSNLYSNILDLVFSNLKNVKVNTVTEPFIKLVLKHSVLEIVLDNANISPLSFDYYYYNFNFDNYNAINIFLANCNWEEFSDINIDTMVGLFSSKLQQAIDYFVPIHRDKNSNFPKWMPRDLKALIILKKKLHRN